MAKIRCVLGDIDAPQGGVTLTHEHVRYQYQGCEFDHNAVWDLEEMAKDVGSRVRQMAGDYGVKTMVDLTPPDIGRHPELIAEVSRRSGVNIVACTGFYAERMGVGFYWRRKSIDYITEMMVRDITEGMVYANKLTPYKAGVIKVATGGMKETPQEPNGLRIGPIDEKMARAAARASRKTGAPIGTHTQPLDYKATNPAIEMLDILEQEGADPAKVMMGHIFIKPEDGQLEALARRGAGLQVDHIGIPWMHRSTSELDDKLAINICRLADKGHLKQIVFSYDMFFSHGRGPITEDEPDQDNTKVKVGYIWESFIPRLEKMGFGRKELDQVLVENPKRMLAL
jgi:phosphotriesterase-related protein